MDSHHNSLTIALIGREIAPHGIAAGGSVANGLLAGQIAVVDANLKVVTSTSGINFYIVQGTGLGKPLIKSPLLNDGDSVVLNPFVSPTHQVTYVGYDGTIGDLAGGAASTNYFFTLKLQNNDDRDRSQGFRKYADYTSNTTIASYAQKGIAAGLADNLLANLASEAEANKLLYVNVVNNSVVGGDAWSVATATGDVTVTNGSKIITTATSTAKLTVGDFLRISDSAIEALTDPVYEIAAISGTQVTLTRAFSGKSGVINDDFIHDVPAIGTNWGVKIQGSENVASADLFANFHVNRFVVSLGENLSSANVTTASHGMEGAGTIFQAARAEFETVGFLGQPTIKDYPFSRSSVIDAEEEYPLASMARTNYANKYARPCYSVLTINRAKTWKPIISGDKTMNSTFQLFMEVSDGSVGTKNVLAGATANGVAITALAAGNILAATTALDPALAPFAV